MSGFWSIQLRFGVVTRIALRLAITIVVGWCVFLYLIDLGNRGFLRSQQRTIWIAARSAPSGTEFRIVKTYKGDGVELQPDPGADWTVEIDERSMGRTHGPTGDWRSNSWITCRALDAQGKDLDVYADKTVGLGDRFPEFDAFMRSTVIPNSDALAIWPDIKPRSVDYSDFVPSWSAWQDRRRPYMIWIIGAVSLAIGFAISLIIPRAATAPPQQSPQADPR